jgi:hypothetical protein
MSNTKIDWKLGWTPSVDSMNGSPEGLVRMDNIQQEEDGCLTLVRGFSQLGGTFPDFVSDLYGKVINGQEYLWVGLNLGREVIRAAGDLSNQTVILSNGGARPCFGDALGQVLIISGQQKKKDDLTTIRNLGLKSQTVAPIVSSINQAQIDLFTAGAGSWAVIEGTLISTPDTDIYLWVDTTTLRGVAELTLDGLDTTDTGDGPAVDPNNDTFYFMVQPGDTSNFTTFRVEIYLDGTGNDYYWYEWPLAGSVQYNLGIDTQSTLSISRGSFNRQGNNSNVSWKTVSKARVIGIGSAYNKFGCGEMRMAGGAAGALNGYYVYCQLDVYDNGTYIAKGAPSPQTIPQYVLNGTANVLFQPNSDPQVNQSWLFRMSLPSPTNFQEVGNINGQNILVQLPVVLDQFYRVAVGIPGGTVVDILSDNDALQQDITLNLYIQSLQDLTDTIIGMEGIYNERMLYLSSSQLYLSDRINPDAIDPRYSIKAFGGNTETNLWIKKISNNTLILATTKDLYEISGTLLDLPDGSLDATVFSIGEAFPPLSQDVCASDGNLFYAASGGWRFTNGSNSLPIDITSGGASRISLLFQGFQRYGIPDFVTNPGNIERYPVAVGRGKFYAVAQCSDGTRRLIIYDLKRGTWRLQFTDPIVIYDTPWNAILLGYALGSGNFVQQMEVGTTGSIDGVEGQEVFIQTVYDHFGQPSARKDQYTLKLVMDTGSQPVTVKLGSDGQGFALLKDYKGNSTVTALTGPQTFYFPLYGVSLGFRYALQITGSNLTTFKLFEQTWEFQPRPAQNTYMNILEDSLGSICRKRFISYALIIDTLNNPVTLQLYIDGKSSDSDVIQTSGGPTVFIHYFQVETIGTQIGCTLLGGPFEFYKVDLQETVSEKMPPPAQYLVIPANNYGSPNRKRHTSYKFQINTLGQPVQFTPIIDGVSGAPQIFTTINKRTVEYFFNTSIYDPIGIDIGGILASLASTEFEFYGSITPQQIEELPPLLETLVIPETNYGSPSRKRFSSYKFQINTFGYNVQYTPRIDGIDKTPIQFSTTERRIVDYFFPIQSDIIATDIGGRLVSLAGQPFEFYGTIIPEQLEQLPPLLESFVIPANNYGKPERKRFTSYKFQINTFGQSVIFTPRIDGVDQPTFSVTTPEKKTVELYLHPDIYDNCGIDIGGRLDGIGQFEFYQVIVPEEVEVLPPLLESLLVPPNNYGSASRKRFSSYKIQINTFGTLVQLIPVVDGVKFPPLEMNTPSKQTVDYYFPVAQDVIGVDIGCILQASSGPFEFYGEIVPEQIEKLPPLLESFVIPVTNYGSSSRKRFSSFKFQINTFGYNVQFMPQVDGLLVSSFIFATASKQTVDYFFPLGTDIIGVDIGGTLQSTQGQPFEFYQVLIPEQIEVLPPLLNSFVIPANNYGKPSRKRFTSYKFQINTFGQPVKFTPRIDGADQPFSYVNTPEKLTVEIYIDPTLYDNCGIDIGGRLDGASHFEFYQVIVPEQVELLPPLLESLFVPPNTFGSPDRKRFSSYKIEMNTFGRDVYMIPMVDGVDYPSLTVNTPKKAHINYYFPTSQDVIGIDIECRFQATTGPFEYYGDISPQQFEVLPPLLERFDIPANNYGKPSRKRHSSYKFMVNTFGYQVLFAPTVDGVTYPPLAFTTPSRQTVEYFFPVVDDVCGVDIGGTLVSLAAQPFEYYGDIVPEQVEVLPPLLTSFVIPATNYGSPSRKRFTSFKFQINTFGSNVKFTPQVDGQNQAPLVFATQSRQIVEYFFNTAIYDVTGIDIGGILQSQSSQPFEFYQVVVPQKIEELPPRLESLVVPSDNFGSPSRKRFSSLKFAINTNSGNVTFVPRFDGVDQPPLNVNTGEKLIVDYFALLNTDTIAVDIGARIFSTQNIPFEFYGFIIPEQLENLPPLLNSFVIPSSNYGKPSRKRFTSYKFQINTFGQPVVFTPRIDGVNQPTATINTPEKLTVEVYLDPSIYDNTGIDIGGRLDGIGHFEFYQVLIPELVEELPPLLESLLVPPNNYGTPNRKRFSTYKLQINTFGFRVKLTPVVDLIQGPPSTISTPSKQTVDYYFPVTVDTIGRDIGCILQSLDHQPFEFYGEIVPQKVETLPDLLASFVIPANNYGTPHRKRHTSYKFQINTFGNPVQFQPILDLSTNYRVGQLSHAIPPLIVNTPSRQTVEYYFPTFYDFIGIDIGGTLESLGGPSSAPGVSGSVTPFEFYGEVVPEKIEVLPDLLESFYIPANDYEIPNRKRHTSYKFEINTFGMNVQFTPVVDMVAYAPLVFSTPSKQQVEYFFSTALGDVTGREIGGNLQALGGGPFEFYGVIVPQTVERLPDRLESLYLPETNYEIAAPKRIRTIPMSINTNGSNVTFQPYVDGSPTPPSVFNTPKKKTVWHFFTTDVFGTDYNGFLSGVAPFEFYGLEKPEIVEILPVPKEYDQVGPIRFDRIGKLFNIRVRLIATGSAVPFQIYNENDPTFPTYSSQDFYDGTLSTVPGVDQIYEIQLPKSINGAMFRVVFGPTSSPFYRFDCQIKVAESGMETDSKWIPIK